MSGKYGKTALCEGIDFEVYKRLGAHIVTKWGKAGTEFSVWAPNAQSVSVITGKTGWNEKTGVMKMNAKGIWTKFISGITEGDSYRYVVTGADGVKRYKSDPYAFLSEKRPANASVVCSLEGYTWNDSRHMQFIHDNDPGRQPVSIYEVHLGSWKRDRSKDKDGFLNYRELADKLADYICYMGYTHIELMGICEHPLDGSWGYQVTGFFSPTSRYGSPYDLRYLVDRMHQCGVGVILDWVPAHFPKDDFSLSLFDGTHLFEPEDPLMADYPEWGTYAFDHGKKEVRNFLISSAYYWVKEFHIDALRVDAVAAMLHTSFGRSSWRKNVNGGDENLESTEFLRILNKTIRDNTDAYLIAEDSSIVPHITDRVEDGGIGFMFKWNMGWMNDSLKYVSMDPLFRKWHHGAITYTAEYSFLENFVLPISHDEVVHLKHSMIGKFPGTYEEKIGGLKAFYCYQFTFPGKKLLFMGQDFAEDREWDESRELDWSLCTKPLNRDVMLCVRALLALYKKYPCLYTDTRDPATFEWICKNDSQRNIISYVRRNPWNYDTALLIVCNFSPVYYPEYICGVPVNGDFRRVFSTCERFAEKADEEIPENSAPIASNGPACDSQPYSVPYILRPYEAAVFEFPTEIISIQSSC